MPNNSIQLYNEALDMWQSNNNETRRHFSGDFTVAEIQGIRSPSEADLIASLLTSKAEFFEKKTVLKVSRVHVK